MNYFLFPSLFYYSTFVYTGDLLRFGSYLCFLVGAAREVDRYWHDQTRLAAVEERRRLARDLHDGLTQELAFIRSQAADMAAGVAVPGIARYVAEAADRRWSNPAGLSRPWPPTPTLPPASRSPRPVIRAAEEVAIRAGAVVKIEVDASPTAPPAVHEALARVTREACTNAVRHGGATTLLLRLSQSDGRLRLTITDDGTGFDPEAVQRGYGLRSMRERVEALGGAFAVESADGQGAVARADLPVR